MVLLRLQTRLSLKIKEGLFCFGKQLGNMHFRNVEKLRERILYAFMIWTASDKERTSGKKSKLRYG